MSAIGRLHHLAFDTREPKLDAEFWSALLGWPITYESPDWVVVAPDEHSSGLAFQLAPDHQPPVRGEAERGQQAHYDVMVDDLEAGEVAVASLGARRLPGPTDGSIWADPSGHPFCLIPRPPWAPPVGEP